MAQVNANVEFSNISQADPHPITYSWNGKKDVVTDPTHYYTFFYVGTVNPDARIEKTTKIERIPVAQDEWEANRKWIVLKLKYYYQITKNMPLTALGEMSGEAPAVTNKNAQVPGTMPGQPGAMNMQMMPGANPMMMGQQGMNPQMMGQQGMNPQMMGQQGMNPQMMGQQGMSPEMGGMQQPGMLNPDGTPVEGQQLDAMGNPINPMDAGMMNQDMTGMTGGTMNFSPMNANFDAEAAAEWTFYYDQLVLWQYYCARQILDKEAELLEPTGAAPPPPGSAAAQLPPGMATGRGGSRGGRSARGGVAGALQGMMNAQNGQAGMMGETGMVPGAANAQTNQISMLDLASATQPGDAGRQTIEAMKKRTRGGAQAGPGMNNAMGYPGGNTGMMGMQGTMGNGMMMNPMLNQMPVMTGGGANNGNLNVTVREMFSPLTDYMNRETNPQYRVKYEAAAEEREGELYKNFLQMVTDIDQRELNQERYEQWLDGKRKELYSYADDWRKADAGDVFTVDDTLFVVTKEPAESLPLNSVNILKADRVTPQDLLNDDGTMRKPKIQ